MRRPCSKKIVNGRLVRARGVYAFWPAVADGDDIVVYKDEDRREILARMPMLRQQESQPDAPPEPVARRLHRAEGQRDSRLPRRVRRHRRHRRRGTGEAFGGGSRRLPGDSREGARRSSRRGVRDLSPRAGPRRLGPSGPRVGDAGGSARRKAPRQSVPRRAIRRVRHHSGKFDLFKLLQAERRDGADRARRDDAGRDVSGFYFSHPQAKYFNVGRIGRDQVESYAKRAGMSIEEAEKWLSPNLSYEPVEAGVKC
jgi:5-methyltetrahydrofolate--homocysteine methyltransferase